MCIRDSQMSKRDLREKMREEQEIDRLHAELKASQRKEQEPSDQPERPARKPRVENKIIGDQLSYAAVGDKDGGQMGRIRKVELTKITEAGGDASWDRVERSTKVGEVTDSLGRRRFHGAFTGGFSAGWFNSVGTKEGWTPQTFRSSRNERAQHKQSVDDFMDDEDKEETSSGQAPVSYTHLRAHETVLDLVCRLLLEKKKTMKT
eukprot:TRINITY_DN12073_c0_g1_i2.p1 TRINITY_DN12073_c0_g1~~TRINITY_DN12073_c0_g1_i2.p1  ORF type:complete len:205 (+),score=46.60 TRINITY_DN12073_c0_g1_i2:169-783(+)